MREQVNRQTYEDRQTPWGRAQAYVKKDLACHLVMIAEDGQGPDVVVGRAVDLD